MSLTSDVCTLIAKKGGATVDELVPEMGCTRDQVMSALKNARNRGFVHTLGWRSRTGKGGPGRAPATYYPGPRPSHYDQLVQPERVIRCRPPASVWELAHGLQIAGDWPLPFDGARVFVSEDEEEAA